MYRLYMYCCTCITYNWYYIEYYALCNFLYTTKRGLIVVWTESLFSLFIIMLVCLLTVRPETYGIVLRVCSGHECNLVRMPASFEHARAVVIERAKHTSLRPVRVYVHNCRSVVKRCGQEPL